MSHEAGALLVSDKQVFLWVARSSVFVASKRSEDGSLAVEKSNLNKRV